jgi:hypothetical protein
MMSSEPKTVVRLACSPLLHYAFRVAKLRGGHKVIYKPYRAVRLLIYTGGIGGKTSSRACYAERHARRRTTNGVRHGVMLEMHEQCCMGTLRLMLKLFF